MVLRRSSRSPGRSGTAGTRARAVSASPHEGEAGPEFSGRDLVHSFVDEITWYMSEHKVSRADLAQSMAVSPGRVSQILSREDNLTLRTLSAVMDALGARFEISLHPLDETGPLGADRG